MKTIVVGNCKGGVGKTTTAVNLAYSLEYMGRRVLAVDMDPQCNLTSFFAKINPNAKTIKDVLENPDKIRSCVCKTKYKGIDVLKGNSHIEEKDAFSSFILQIALEQVEKNYDYCIIDTRPVFENLTMNALNAADMLLTPVYLDKFCRDNLSLVEEYLDELKSRTGSLIEWKVFATKVSARRKAQRNTYEDLVAKHDYPLLDTCISNSAAVENALELHKPVNKHRSGCQVARDYLELAREIMDLLEG